jgi:hypothetical protein
MIMDLKMESLNFNNKKKLNQQQLSNQTWVIY